MKGGGNINRWLDNSTPERPFCPSRIQILPRHCSRGWAVRRCVPTEPLIVSGQKFNSRLPLLLLSYPLFFRPCHYRTMNEDDSTRRRERKVFVTAQIFPSLPIPSVWCCNPLSLFFLLLSFLSFSFNQSNTVRTGWNSFRGKWLRGRLAWTGRTRRTSFES